MYSLSPFVGNGTALDPFRPDVSGPYSIIDLRSDSTRQAGFCLLSADSLPTGSVHLGDDLDAPTPRNIARGLENVLNLTLDSTDRLRSIIAELLILHGREDGTRWRRLRASRDGRNRIFLGGLVFDAPVVVGATIGDTFVEASDTILQSHTATGVNGGFAWARIGGAAGDITVRAASDDAIGSGSNQRYRAESDLASDDHSAELTAVNLGDVTSDRNVGPVVRYDAAADSFYVLIANSKATDTYRLFKVTTGSFSQLATVSTTAPGNGVVLRLNADGSALEGFADDVSVIGPTTDTSFSGQLRAGVLDSNTAVIDDFEAADLAAAVTITASPAVVTVSAQVVSPQVAPPAGVSNNMLLLGIG